MAQRNFRGFSRSCCSQVAVPKFPFVKLPFVSLDCFFYIFLYSVLSFVVLNQLNILTGFYLFQHVRIRLGYSFKLSYWQGLTGCCAYSSLFYDYNSAMFSLSSQFWFILFFSWWQANGVVDLIEDGSLALRYEQRLILTTHLMQKLLCSAPSAILSADATTRHEVLVYAVSRIALGDACSTVYHLSSLDVPCDGMDL